ncbi:MAG: hypothetical protein AB1427_01115 [Thermodesulfobacteriota bacterium]
MKMDLYTKGVLTVIALCLVWICAREIPFIKTAEAFNEGKPAEVVIKNVEPLAVALYAQIDTKNPNAKYTWVPLEAIGLERDIYSNYKAARLVVSTRE